jgi:hypothetical protein
VLANVVTTDGTQTLTNKTITGGTVDATTLQQGGVQAVTTTGTQTLTNKTISQAQITNLTTDLAAKFPLNVSTSAQTASYTLVAGDAQKIVEMGVGSANTLTIPTNDNVAFPVGTSILVVQTGAGQTTIAGAAGVTVNSYLGLKIAGQWGAATLVKRATNTWVAIGALVA